MTQCIISVLPDFIGLYQLAAARFTLAKPLLELCYTSVVLPCLAFLDKSCKELKRSHSHQYLCSYQSVQYTHLRKAASPVLRLLAIPGLLQQAVRHYTNTAIDIWQSYLQCV